ncbi:MAG: cupredoxin domain-containing protein [Gemmatimonadaceae bacterium]
MIMAGCGGGGAAVDAVSSGGSPAAETPAAPPPSPPGGGISATVSTPDDTFSPRVVTITPGSTVTWQISGTRHNVTFGSLQPTGGNIPDTQSSSVSRAFPSAGTYDYLCTRHSGMTGQVIVSGSGSQAPGGPPQESPPVSETLVTVTRSGYTPERAEIAPGGAIVWEFAAGADGILFDEEGPPGSDIPESAAGSRVSRTFPAEGDYDYRSLKDRDKKGRIRVR